MLGLRDSREVLKHNGEKIFVDLLDGKVTNENMLMNYLEEIAAKCNKLPLKKRKTGQETKTKRKAKRKAKESKRKQREESKRTGPRKQFLSGL